MGFFDRLRGKTNGHNPVPNVPAQAEATPMPAPAAGDNGANPVSPRLQDARKLLDNKDITGAMAIYEQVLAEAGERADVLVTISGDLGMHGFVQEIVELIAPRYDAERHGPATGLNVLQAYLVLRNPEAAQHVLDILFELDRPELEDRLHGFSNAIAELIEERRQRGTGSVAGNGTGQKVEAARVELVTISKPIWFYGLENMATEILPQKGDRLRRVAFAQLGVLGVENLGEAMSKPETELARLSRAIPLWFAETLYFCPHYVPVAALGLMKSPSAPEQNQAMVFGAEWTSQNVRQLAETSQDPLDYVFTGAISEQAGDYQLVLRLWEVKKFRERKQFQIRWTPATADRELGALHEQLRVFLEFSSYPAGAGIAYVPPAKPRAWLEVIGASFGWFMADKKLLPCELLRPVAEDLAAADALAAGGVAASLASLTLRKRARALGIEISTTAEPSLSNDPLVEKAKKL